MTFAAVAVANPDRLPILSEWNGPTMTSLRQIEANRRNAMNSTGGSPRTVGMAVVRSNAGVWHGAFDVRRNDDRGDARTLRSCRCRSRPACGTR